MRAELDSMRAQIPGGVRIQTLFDRSVGIEQSVRDVKRTLLLTLGLVVVVIFLFLRNFWATLIPSLALPLSVVGTFPVMYVLSYSLDTLSLMALTLAVGFVVDDAIVMLENIVRHLEMGKPPIAGGDRRRDGGRLHDRLDDDLAHRGLHSPALSRRRRRPPVPRVRGRDRDGDSRVGRRVADVHADARRAVSCARRRARSTTAFYNAIERAYDWLLDQYTWTLDWTMRHRPLALVFSLLVLVGTALLFKFVPTGFIPDQDIGQINITTEAAQGASYDDMVRRQQVIAGDRAERHERRRR